MLILVVVKIFMMYLWMIQLDLIRPWVLQIFLRLGEIAVFKFLPLKILVILIMPVITLWRYILLWLLTFAFFVILNYRLSRDVFYQPRSVSFWRPRLNSLSLRIIFLSKCINCLSLQLTRSFLCRPCACRMRERLCTIRILKKFTIAGDELLATIMLIFWP